VCLRGWRITLHLNCYTPSNEKKILGADAGRELEKFDVLMPVDLFYPSYKKMRIILSTDVNHIACEKVLFSGVELELELCYF
jgi:hypothetical protein